METADQIIGLLRQAALTTGDSRVCAAYEALMGELAVQLVGEPLADGEVSDAEWVLLGASLRQLGRSPRSRASWARIQGQAADLQAALTEVEMAQAAALTAPAQQEMATPSRRSSLRPAWLSVLVRNRAAQPEAAPPVAAPAEVVPARPAPAPLRSTTVVQSVHSIQNSQHVTIESIIHPAEVLEMDDALDEETEPAEPERTSPACDIFLSYSRRDARLMRRVRADLRAQGFDVWTDESLKPGTPSWLSAVEQAIRSCLCVVVLLTPDSKKSEWVEKELSMAKIQRRQIIPLLARGDEKSAIPLLLSNTQYADIRSETDYKRKMRDLSRVLQNLQRGAKARA